MSNKPNYKTARKYKCPYCDLRATRGELVDHVEKAHEDLIPEEYTAARAVYDSINGKNYGTCMICKSKVYEWNDKINKYYNLCKKPECRNKVRETALARHMKVYNKPTLLNDAEHQEKMLANRRISGTYTFSDGKKFTYTGKYERNALEFMDKVLAIPSSDILTPGPVLEYEYQGNTHKWITDIFYIPANLIIEIKDGGSNPNTRTMTSYRDKQIAKEVMITDKGTYNYIRLTNNNFAQLLDIFADMKNGALNDDTKARVHINESHNDEYSYVSLSEKEKDDIMNIINSFDNTDKDHVGGGYFLNHFNILYCNIKYISNDPAGFIAVCQRKKGRYGFIILGVKKDYRGNHIGSTLSRAMIEHFKKSKKCETLVWNVDFGNDISATMAKNIGFKLFKKDNTSREYEYRYELGKPINEEVGGLPPHRPPEAYIVPYGMNNVFDGYAYTDSDMDKFITIDDDNHILPMAESVFYETFTTGPSLYYTGTDIIEKIKKIHEAIGDNGKFGKYEIVGHLIDGPIYKAEDVLLSGKFKYYDKELEEQTLKMLENGITVKINGDTDIIETIGNVFIHISPNGYYATTPEDFYLASEYFESRELLDASGLVDIMNDIYASNSKTKGEISDV